MVMMQRGSSEGHHCNIFWVNVVLVAMFLCPNLQIAVANNATVAGNAILQPHKVHVAVSASTATSGGCRKLLAVQAQCKAEEDIVLLQGPVGPSEFLVQMINTCIDGCSSRDIHVSCGAFGSDSFVNPALFNRVALNDCVVKAGGALAPSEGITFRYVSAVEFPLSVASATMLC
ncbi:hypothetical protein GOP47_0010716 [Adiantum capillus-veneris]|uniref:Uncharacterized protein n=1 Tax=Adiantum capillus-veneris TaxID=13818 RepID=A0A9D4ZJ22_ADICA|nr:hypothetical protein GOP47_0010716 [Adiantum capillus-veneris]